MPYRTKESERLRSARRRLTQHYKDYQREYQKKWREKNKEKWKDIRDKSDNRPERKKYCRQWQRESPKFKEIKKRFKETGRHREWEAERKKNNFEFKLKGTIRHRIKDSFEIYLRKEKIDKIKSSDEYGINYKEIIQHLIKTLPKDFNEKKYEIDHIIACCLFDLTNQEEIKKCFAPENHQWFSVEEHKKKTLEDIRKLKEMQGR